MPDPPGGIIIGPPGCIIIGAPGCIIIMCGGIPGCGAIAYARKQQ
jgi:hypothetical protein